MADFPKVIILKKTKSKGRDYGKPDRLKAIGSIQAEMGQPRDVRFLPSGVVLILVTTLLQLRGAMNIRYLDKVPYMPTISKYKFIKNKDKGHKNKNKNPHTRKDSTLVQGVIYRVPLHSNISPDPIPKVINTHRFINRQGQPSTTVLVTFSTIHRPYDVTIDSKQYKVYEYRDTKKPGRFSSDPAPVKHTPTPNTPKQSARTLTYAQAVNLNKATEPSVHNETIYNYVQPVTPPMTARVATLLGSAVLIARNSSISDDKALEMIWNLAHNQVPEPDGVIPCCCRCHHIPHSEEPVVTETDVGMPSLADTDSDITHISTPGKFELAITKISDTGSTKSPSHSIHTSHHSEPVSSGPDSQLDVSLIPPKPISESKPKTLKRRKAKPQKASTPVNLKTLRSRSRIQ